ncbi:MAG: hypothetical protein AB2L14_32925 [Candidatus Xenobiia bacterium LiM19]
MSKNLKISFYILLIICSISFIASIILIISHVRKESKIIANAKQSSLNEVKRSAEQVDALLKKIENTADSVTEEPSDISDTAALNKRFKEILEKDLGISMICVAFAPYRHDPENRLYAPSAQMIDDKVVFFQMEADTDYTESSWYKDTVAAGSPIWSEPSMSDRIKGCTVSYTIPFSLPDGDKGIAGVVNVTIPLSTIRKYASSIELGNAILRLIISKKGVFIYYPLNEVVENRINILDAIKKGNDRFMEERLMRVLSGDNISFESKDPGSSSTYMSFYEHIPSSGWCIAGSYLLEQFTLSETVYRRQQIQIILALIVFLTTIAALLSRAYLLDKISLWITSIVFTILCLSGTLYIWSIVYTAPLKQDSDRIFLTDNVKIQKALSKYESYIMKTHIKHPVRIPTGIYLQSLEYVTSNDLKAVGYLWLKYPLGNKDVVVHEPTFPEATSVEMQEVSHRSDGDSDVIRWRFEVTLRESFDYSKYPLDRPDIWIWIKSGDFENREVLIPDLGSYKATSPQNGPGLPENGFVFPGYTLMGSYFDYRESIATTDFGVKNTYDLETFPELYFHVVGRRNVLNPFVSKVFPLLIILSMLFVVKLKFTNSEEGKRTFGLNGIAVLGTVISFFFSTMLSQSTFRTEINVERITFMENFHLITYLMLFYMSVTTFFFIGTKVPSILEYEDCLLSKILYWPIITGLVLMSTIFYYY